MGMMREKVRRLSNVASTFAEILPPQIPLIGSYISSDYRAIRYHLEQHKQRREREEKENIASKEITIQAI